MFRRRHFAACFVALLSSSASAEVLQERNMPMDMALELAQGAVKACAADNYNVSAAVVDRAGVLRALLRADNAGVHTPDAARRKAYTAVSARTPTSAMAKNVQDNPGAAQLVAIDDFLILAGGVPVKIGNETIGAVGVGGAPGGNLDEACALAAIKEIEGKLK
ncbi:heme-binding protein [Mesorhizobium sp. VK23B]|uniref:Heme-binding protein n=1 Tax=Mesorhizobium dulcispinae TaxID=3072316 RepID=A0ABU4XC06_9HYPH|nr:MULTISPECIES: heme-binding protein [unclassified Mesorhizobium]MDX8466511.1 heme-binding protein [Mesorhizobium sp. VK23B]MDX8472321.1 heme-binding protein [Mesorhizobium sp. VK23A]